MQPLSKYAIFYFLKIYFSVCMWDFLFSLILSVAPKLLSYQWLLQYLYQPNVLICAILLLPVLSHLVHSFHSFSYDRPLVNFPPTCMGCLSTQNLYSFVCVYLIIEVLFLFFLCIVVGICYNCSICLSLSLCLSMDSQNGAIYSRHGIWGHREKAGR